jgi:Calx-beta domain
LKKPDYFAGRRIARRIAIGATVLSTVFGGLLSLGGFAHRASAVTLLTAVTTQLEINNVSQAEGNSGTSAMTFTITNKAASQANDCLVNVSTTNGTAVNPAALGGTGPNDWEMVSPYLQTEYSSRPVLIKAGSTAAWSVNIVGDTTEEASETFFVTLSLAVGQGTYGTDSWIPPCFGVTANYIGTGTITRDDEASRGIWSITAPTPTLEGNTGTTPALFTLKTTEATTEPCGVAINVSNITAAIGLDYDLSIPPAGATPAAIGAPGDVSKVTYYPYLSTGYWLRFPAGTPKDYTFKIPVNIIGETLVEGDETFSTTLTSYNLVADTLGTLGCGYDTSAPLASFSPIATITNDDFPAEFSIASPAAITEGNSGTTPLNFTISAKSAPAKPCQLYVVATNVSALWGASPSTLYADYTVPGGGTGFPGILPYTKVIDIDSATTNFTIDVIGDLIKESPTNETFLVTIGQGILTNPCALDTSKAGLLQATGTIIDDDADPAFTIIAPAPVVEGNSGSKQVKFLVKSGSATATPCQIYVSAWNVTAAVFVDYDMDGVAAPLYAKIINFAAGQSQQEVVFNIFGDTINEGDETFYAFLALGTLTTCPLDGLKPTATATIVDDDAIPVYSLSAPVTTTEGNTGVTKAKYTVSSPTSPNAGVKCQLAVAATNITALWPWDYKLPDSPYWYKTMDIDAATGEFSVDINGDVYNEGNETYTVTIASGVGANPCLVNPAKFTVVSTIVDDDVAPVFNLTGPDSIVEGNTGTTPATYKITSATGTATAAPCQVLFTALNETAIWPIDWKVAGESTNFFKVITIDGLSANGVIDIVGDTLFEADETYTVNIVGTGANPCPVDLTKRSVRTTIVNDETALGQSQLTFAAPGASQPGVAITGGTGTGTGTGATAAAPAASSAPSTTAAPAAGSGSASGTAASGGSGSASATGSVGGSSGNSTTTTTAAPAIVPAADIAPAPAAQPAVGKSKVLGEVASVAYTGASSTALALFALACIALGLALLSTQRRRSEVRHS